MLTGKIRSLNADKGFGFIKPSAGGGDVFFHCSAVDADFKSLRLEQSVQYEPDPGADKPRAKQVVTGMARRQPAGRGSDSSRLERPKVDYAFGFVTKLPRKEPIGFISSVEGGPEYYFEPSDVRGKKKFELLRVGDYVRFIPRNNPDDPKQPFARSVMVVPKPINPQENTLARHPKARRKKPTWKQ